MTRLAECPVECSEVSGEWLTMAEAQAKEQSPGEDEFEVDVVLLRGKGIRRCQPMRQLARKVSADRVGSAVGRKQVWEDRATWE